MKGITKKIAQASALVAILGLASCTTQPVVPEGTDPGTSTGNGNGGTGGNGNNTSEVYVVQLIASNSAPKAEQIKNEFVGEGYPAVVHEKVVNGQTLYRVQIGAYGTEADAQRVLDQMKRRYQRNEHVRNAVAKTKNGI